MFEKLLSLLPHNPGLAQQLGFYSRRMREEAAIRRTGMVFIVLAFFVQFFAVIAPPTSAGAASAGNNNLLYGGFTSVAEAQSDCTNDVQGYQAILNYYGISCDDVGNGHIVSSLNSESHGSDWYSMGYYPCNSGSPHVTCTAAAPNETPVSISGAGRVYWRSIDTFGDFNFSALQLTSTATGHTFWLETLCGNLLSVGIPTKTPPLKIAPPPTPPHVPSGNLPVPPPATKVPTTQAPPDLGINTATCTELTGWASENESNSSEVIKVEVYADGPEPATTGGVLSGPTTYVGEVTNDGHGYPQYNPSWSMAIPSSYQTAPHTYYIYDLNSDFTWTGPGITGSGPVYGADPIAVPACPAPTTPPTNGTPTTPPTTPTCPDSTMPNSNGICDACKFNPAIAATDSQCKPCSAATSTQDSLDCVVISKSATNVTQNIADANNTTAHPGDVITYTLSAQNTGKATVQNYLFQENMADVLSYATITTANGATLDNSNLLSWPTVDIAAGQTATVQVTVTVKNPLPTPPANPISPTLFDLIMTNSYGNTININLPGATPAQTVTTTATSLVNTGPGTSLFIAAAIVMVAGYFYARARLLSKESLLAIQDTEG